MSKKWKLNSADLAKWSHNTLVFLAPLGLIYLGSVQPNLADGFAWSDFALTPMVSGALALYIVNVILDLFKKLSAGESY